jgi:hypothetical protein
MYLYCLKCRVKQVANDVEIVEANSRFRVVGKCSVCETKMGQYVSSTDTIESLNERYSTPAVAAKKTPTKKVVAKNADEKPKKVTRKKVVKEEESVAPKKVVKRVVRRKKVEPEPEPEPESEPEVEQEEEKPKKQRVVKKSTEPTRRIVRVKRQ